MKPAHTTTIAVLGDGGWGTTLAAYLHGLGHEVRWWSAFPAYAKELARRRENVKFLPGVRLPKTLFITSALDEAVSDAAIVVVAVPSRFLRRVARRLRPLLAPRAIIVSVAKGLELGSLKRMSEVIQEEARPAHLAVLSGPNIAAEIAHGQPASSVIASTQLAVARQLQQLFMSEQFRLYTSTDVIGVELGGALKNPIAIAAGICDGLELGTNAKAALISRGVVEMARLGVACGAKQETFWGLSGLGDLITTCLRGRNRQFGEALGRGQTLKAILADTPMVIEGVDTAKSAIALARRKRMSLPIIDQVEAILFRRKSPRSALRDLMTRSRKAE